MNIFKLVLSKKIMKIFYFNLEVAKIQKFECYFKQVPTVVYDMLVVYCINLLMRLVENNTHNYELFSTPNVILSSTYLMVCYD